MVMLSRALQRPISTLKTKFLESLGKTKEDLNLLKKNYSDIPVGSITVDQIIGGMRGIKGILTETSKVDPYDGITFRGYDIPKCQTLLPAKHSQPLAESMFWLLLTGQIPTKAEVEELRSEFASRAALPDYTVNLLNSLPKNMHPMVQLSIAVLSLQPTSVFEKAYNKGLKKADYWEPTLEDACNLVAKIPTIAAIIYRNVYRDGKVCDLDPSLDLAGNYSNMLGYEDHQFHELMRLYLVIHSDHEGGNVSAHSTHLVGSALSDAYKSYSAGLNGLAGPLHGLANQECLKWLLECWERVGDDATERAIEVYVKDTLASGKVVPGYGHAVLRKTDPRFTVQLDFAKSVMKGDPLIRIVEMCYNVVPRVLKEQGKAANPWPNVDAISGSLLYYFGLKEFDYYTVLFGVSRTMGVMASLVWSRALGLPIERPESVTLEDLESLVKKT